jgi:transcriptional regulator with XRE-family HTH domain
MSQLSENIKYLRKTSGTSQNEYGKGFGVSRDNIASYERGISPKLEFLQKLVNFYHISMENLVNSNLKSIFEDEKKLNLKTRPNLDLNLDPIHSKISSKENQVKDTIENYKSISNFNNMIFKMQLERIESLSAENAVLKKENSELRAENAKLKGNSGYSTNNVPQNQP